MRNDGESPREATPPSPSEEALTEAGRFELLASATNDALWDWDLATDRVWWSQGVETLFGHRRDEVGDRMSDWMAFVHPEDRPAAEELMQEVMESGGREWRAAYRFRRADGTWAHVLDRGRLFRDDAGETTRIVGGMTDTTRERQLEAELARSRHLEGLGRLAGGVAHDFNNILTAILGVLDLQLASPPEDPELASDLREIRRSAERAADLTRQLLAFGRRQVLHPPAHRTRPERGRGGYHGAPSEARGR